MCAEELRCREDCCIVGHKEEGAEVVQGKAGNGGGSIGLWGR